MSSGFVPAGTILPPAPAVPENAIDAAWAAARAAVSSSTTSAPTSTAPSAPEDTRSLYEILQSNKARKQEEFEEKLKFKNQFRALDEEDVEFLDSVLDGQRRVEMERKRAVEGEVERFREAQLVVERRDGEEEGEEGEKWGKRKRGGEKRKGSLVAEGKKVEEEEKVEKGEGKAEKEEGAEAGKAEKKKVEVLPRELNVKAAPPPPPPPLPPPPAAVLGLDYGSDDDDD
ncbi:N-terminal domain of NEFA-interacting nuclear protein NIP30-domain-containing protein [Trichophaea hybrida]|nr:N-terminal domain of NEFA-interacting nuclear protein NIP30-domain-containing protein [Trichophaea hybrida]